MTSSMNRVAVTLMIGILLLFSKYTSPVDACLHSSAQGGTVQESGQRGIIYWHDGHEDLILSVDFSSKTPNNHRRSRG